MDISINSDGILAICSLLGPILATCVGFLLMKRPITPALQALALVVGFVMGAILVVIILVCHPSTSARDINGVISDVDDKRKTPKMPTEVESARIELQKKDDAANEKRKILKRAETKLALKKRKFEELAETHYEAVKDQGDAEVSVSMSKTQIEAIKADIGKATGEVQVLRYQCDDEESTVVARLTAYQQVTDVLIATNRATTVAQAKAKTARDSQDDEVESKKELITIEEDREMVEALAEYANELEGYNELDAKNHAMDQSFSRIEAYERRKISENFRRDRAIKRRVLEVRTVLEAKIVEFEELANEAERRVFQIRTQQQQKDRDLQSAQNRLKDLKLHLKRAETRESMLRAKLDDARHSHEKSVAEHEQAKAEVNAIRKQLDMAQSAVDGAEDAAAEAMLEAKSADAEAAAARQKFEEEKAKQERERDTGRRIRSA